MLYLHPLYIYRIGINNVYLYIFIILLLLIYSYIICSSMRKKIIYQRKIPWNTESFIIEFKYLCKNLKNITYVLCEYFIISFILFYSFNSQKYIGYTSK